MMVGQMLVSLIPSVSSIEEEDGKLVTKPIIRLVEAPPEFDDDWA